MELSRRTQQRQKVIVKLRKLNGNTNSANTIQRIGMWNWSNCEKILVALWRIPDQINMFAMYEEKNGQGGSLSAVSTTKFRGDGHLSHFFFYMRKYAIIEFNKCQILSRKSVTKCAEESQRWTSILTIQDQVWQIEDAGEHQKRNLEFSQLHSFS